MTVVVTGSSGFIGAALAGALLRSGQRVLGIDRVMPPSPISEDPQFSQLTMELSDIRPESLDGVSIVYHCSAATGISDSWGTGLRPYVEDNIVATNALLDACRQQDINRFVYLGSGQSYGNASRTGDSSAVGEGALPSPFSPYAVTKCAGENLVNAYAGNFRLPAVILRLFYVVGPGQRNDVLVYKLIDNALRGATLRLYANAVAARRDFVHVMDVVDAILAAGDPAIPALGATINIGSGVATPLEELIRRIADMVGVGTDFEVDPGPAGHVNGAPADIELAGRILDWSPRRSLNDALTEQVRWQRSLGC